MDKNACYKIVRETFQNPFDKERFLYFTKNLLNKIDETKAFHARGYVPEIYKNYVKTYERLATYTDPDGHKIDIVVVYLQKETSLERARTAQRNFIARYLKDRDQKDAGLVAFVSPNPDDWRFSLVKMDYRFEEGKSGRIKVKEEFTPARRWSFLVGKNEDSHTIQSRLVPVMETHDTDPTTKDLEDAFNIERVTNEFFLKYRDLFIRTKEALDAIVNNDARINSEFQKKGINTVDFAKKLLGQIIFLYFLQKKGWFGVGRDAAWGTGSKHFLRELFKRKHGNYDNFFDDILEPLFYEALRVGEERKQDDFYYSRFKCKIPFLNGGLFDPIGNYNWVYTDIQLPDDLFSNTNKTAEGDTGDGILDVFDRYNFTVKEDEPLEKEVAIDPELLGKAYEKFNAIRPDNFEEYKKALKSGKKGDESKFNKQFGVYYTPREIVHYMCQQSLINYLSTELNSGMVSYQKLGDSNLNMFGNEVKAGQLDINIGHRENPEISRNDIDALIHLGEQVSENEARVEIKGKETPTYSYKLPENIRKNAKLIDRKLASITVCDPAVGSGAFPVGMMTEIVRTRNVLSAFIENEQRTPYDFKRQCIEHSLYGVDIDPGAVEIAKLRLWLSLVVDEENIKNIKPLPNLDYKIVCGNSLLGYPYTPLGLESIEKLKNQFIEEVNPTRKNELRSQIDDAIHGLLKNTEKSLGYKVTMDFKITFSEVFHQKGGFDVVIANPPYISALEFSNRYSEDLRNRLNGSYQTAKGSYDIYVLFIEKGLSLLAPDRGVLVFITPNKYLSANYAIALRQFIISKYALIQLVDLSPINIFEEASVYPVISIIRNKVFSKMPIKVLLPPNRQVPTFNEGDFTNLSIERVLLNILPENLWGFLLSNKVNLLSKIIKNTKQLQELGSVNATSTASESDIYGKFITDQENEESLKIVNTGTIDKWVCLWGIAPMTHAGKKFLTPYLPQKKAKVNPRRQAMYKSPKIVFAKMAKNCEAFLDIEGNYASINTNCFYNPSSSVSLESIAAICNSRLFMFLYEQFFGALRMSGGYFQFQAPQLRVIPIKEPDPATSDDFNSVVHQIIEAKSKDIGADISLLERKIDQLVYSLYGLKDDDIRLVEDQVSC